MIIKLTQIPVLLNKLYIPIVRNGKAAMVKTKEAKEFLRYVQMECLRQKVKLIPGTVSFKMDILISKRKNFDIDAVNKLLFDSLESIAYTNDKNIIEYIARKHIDQEEDALIIEIKEIK